MSVLFDTGVLYAFLNDDDPLHDRAVALMERIQAKEFGAPFVTDLVVAELFNLIRARRGPLRLERAARRLLPMPQTALPGLSPISLGTAVLERAWATFERYRDQGLSFTDATLVVTLQELRIDALATFDGRLAAIVPVAV
jgi:predicted nucleic acid-binding protein